MNPADVRALLAVMLRGQDIAVQQQAIEQGETAQLKVSTYDTYLAAAQMVLESSWNPANYKHPAGMDNSQLGVDEATALLESKGYMVVKPTFESAFTTSPNPSAPPSPPATTK